MKIIAAAVKVGDKTYQGRRHFECIKAAFLETQQRVMQDQQGFLTDTGEFVSRRAAMKIARNAGQLKEKTINKEKLFSEDLW